MTMTEKAKAWWKQLTQQEQILVMIMSIFIAIFALYAFIYQPLTNGLAKAEKTLKRQQSLNNFVQEQTTLYKQSKKSGSSSRSSLTSIVNATAGKKGITIARMQPQGDALQVWIDEVPFVDLVDWLAIIKKKNGVLVKAIDLSKQEQSGIVKVRRLQLGKS